MSQLHQLRDQIDDIDRQLSALISKRFEYTDAVSKAKLEKDEAIYVPERERAVLENVLSSGSEASARELSLLCKSLMRLSRSRQYSAKYGVGKFTLKDLNFESAVQPGAGRLSFAFSLHRSFDALFGIFMLFCDNGFELLDLRLHPMGEQEHLICMDVAASPDNPKVISVLYQLQQEMPSLRLLSWH